MPTRGRETPKTRYIDPLQEFRELMPTRVQRLLLVGSHYDFFLLWEDGQLSEHLLSEWLYVHLSSTTWITRVSNSDEALAACREQNYDLVVVTPHIRGMGPVQLGLRLLQDNPRLSVVPLAFDDNELASIRSKRGAERLERPFLWQGDFRLLLGIVQSIEDRWNVGPDTDSVGVSVIILIEDSVHYYSSFLPNIYEELNKQSQRSIAEATNLHHKVMRMRARPKILHCTTYEEAKNCFDRHRKHVLGLISDINFPRSGSADSDAGLDFARMVRAQSPDLPIMLQTNEPSLAEKVGDLRVTVEMKRSPTLIEDLGRFLRQSFGFGDFVFKRDSGESLGRASGLRELERLLETTSEDVVLQHASRNDFSTWLRARTEFRLAEVLRAASVADFDTPLEVREYLVETIRDFRLSRQGGGVADFSPNDFNPRMSFARIGGGSLGGKARGLGFVRSLLQNYEVRRPFPDVDIFVPAALVIATGIFDRFLEDSDLLDFAMQEEDDAEIEKRFIEARLPDDVFRQLLDFIELVNYPLAVRSSSLLEDSQNFSLTGAYRTYMVPNSHPDRGVRVKELIHAIKRVYASTFFSSVKSSFLPSPYRLEEEKMAVIIQRMIGSRHDNRFYPDFSGVVRSHNFYPSGPMKAEDGIARVGLGLGEVVVAGERTLSFCPSYPDHPVQFSTPEEMLENSQRDFYALELEGEDTSPDPAAELTLSRFGINTALEDGKLRSVGSIYSRENNAVYDGISRKGVPLVTFAPILKQETFPLARILRMLLDVGKRSLNMPVEIEFAANMPQEDGDPTEFAFLQMRPFALHSGETKVDLDRFDTSRILCQSRMVLGNGLVEEIRDIVVVNRNNFDRARTAEAAQKIGEFNATLTRDTVPYLLIGVGRWGSADPWLGIPVSWPQIAGCRVMIESDFKDMATTPSQGSHFFHNIINAGIGYFTVDGKDSVGEVDWDWLESQTEIAGNELVRHIRLDEPILVVMDGRTGQGLILKPTPANP